MKYTRDIIIDRPRAEVVALFDNPSVLAEWQQGFVSMSPLSGDVQGEGRQSHLVYDMGKRRIEMVETVVEHDLPYRVVATYETAGVWNRVENHFEEIEPTKTRWLSHVEFRFDNFMMKLMGSLMPKMFQKQTETYMKDFKAFVEKRAA
ncbi:SRPBCC family protein [Parvularcula sp. LCG005]|uniref:SRPBCC family protein n=1 Tax=Parvularcula sp. LCG005 TaxID=3078805 RepID=UPI00294303E4|nr:SRPBCC family protein [Parvularcula sp. LCG005]WOI54508.1 SRPBCC family protein [Parvularcula sp. LCG005]